MKIKEAVYLEGDNSSTIYAVSLTKQLYFSKYRGRLFCPGEDCPARLSFVERKKSGTKYFRTWSKQEHKKGCTYEVNYDEENVNKAKEHSEERLNISDRHINDKLRRAFEEFVGKENAINFKGKQRNNRPKGPKNLEPIGVPALFNKGTDSINGKEPYIMTRIYDKLDETDFNQTRCVIGYVKSVSLFDNHAYMNLTAKNERSVKVYFSQYFRANNQAQFANLNIIMDFIQSMKEQNKPIICCCVGYVKKVETDINIHPDRYNGFILNGLGFYDIVREGIIKQV